MPQAKIVNGQVAEYPYSEIKLRKDNPNTSFPKPMSVQSLEAHGVYQVVNGEKPSYDERTQELQKSDQPTLSNGSWILEYSVRDKTTEEIAEYDDGVAQDNRAKRNSLLSQTDFYALTDVTLSADMTSYRQALRDITNHANWPHLEEADWPVAP
jgi:hypothetical protein